MPPFRVVTRRNRALYLSFALGVLLFLLTLASSKVHAQTLGDINRDGALTVCDLDLLQRHLSSNASNGFPRLTTNNLALPLADVDTNGVLNNDDFKRLLDTILGRIPEQDFDRRLLNYDDGDGFTYLEDWHFGTNPFLRDTDGDDIEDEIDINTSGAVFVAQPPVNLLRLADENSLLGIVLAQPPVDVLLSSSVGGAGVILAQPPVDVLLSSSVDGAGVILAQPPVDVLRLSSEQGLGISVAQPPVKVLRP